MNITKEVYREAYSVEFDDPDMVRNYAYQSIMKTRIYYDLVYNGIYNKIETRYDSLQLKEVFSLVAQFTAEQYEEYEKRRMISKISGDL